MSFSVSWCEALGTRIIWGLGTWDCRNSLERSDHLPEQLRRCFSSRPRTTWLQNSKWPPKKTNSTHQYHTNNITLVIIIKMLYTYNESRLFTVSHHDTRRRIKRLSLYFNKRSLLTDNPPIPERVGHTTGVYVPYSFRTVVWVLLRPTRRYVKVLWDRTYGFSSLAEDEKV